MPMDFVGQSKRLPIYLVIDVSASMAGAPIEAVNNGLRDFENLLRTDPHALETAYVSVITFDNDARVVTPLCPVGTFRAPKLATGGATAFGRALESLGAAIAADVKPKGPDHPGDWRPLVFFFTDGQPTDAWRPALKQYLDRISRRPATVYAIGCGPKVDVEVLRALSSNVLLSSDLSAERIKSLFAWISQSARVASHRAGAVGANPGSSGAKLPPPPAGFTVAI